MGVGVNPLVNRCPKQRVKASCVRSNFAPVFFVSAGMRMAPGPVLEPLDACAWEEERHELHRRDGSAATRGDAAAWHTTCAWEAECEGEPPSRQPARRRRYHCDCGIVKTLKLRLELLPPLSILQ